jgi:hypothetical protein
MKATRAEAIQENQAEYFTNKPCKNGHLSPRDTRTCECVTCRKEWSLRASEQVKALREQFKKA